MIFLFRLILINVFIEELIYFLSLFNKEYFLLGDLFENFLFWVLEFGKDIFLVIFLEEYLVELILL